VRDDPLSNDDYRTDQWILDMFPAHQWFDPCPLLGLNQGRDGLAIEWPSHVFVNPPYSEPHKWVNKALDELKNGSQVIVMLLKHDSSTRWFRSLHEAGAQFLLVSGRLKHQTGKSANFPSVLAVLTSKHTRDLLS
jgi:hypothetical protein